MGSCIKLNRLSSRPSALLHHLTLNTLSLYISLPVLLYHPVLPVHHHSPVELHLILFYVFLSSEQLHSLMHIPPHYDYPVAGIAA